MNIFRNILAIILGVLIGSIVNMTIISFSSEIIAPPVNTDLTTMEGLLAAMEYFEPKHFLMPFLAHAIGTLVGAMLAAMIAIKNKLYFALGIGAFFFLGGLINVVILPSPVWFALVDLGLAYFPMAYLGYRLGVKK